MKNSLYISASHLLLVLLELFSYLSFYPLLVAHYNLLQTPFQAELREGAILLTTDLMIKGGNPFSASNQPQYANVYGVFYHIVVFPFAKIFGSTLIVHRLVSAFFIFATVFLIFIILYKKRVPLPFSLSAITILYGSLLYFVTPLARPDALGTFLFLFSLCIPWFNDYSPLSLLISILVGTLAFFTKAYFALSIPILALYLFLFISKRRGILYGIVSLLFLLALVFYLNLSMNCYVDNTIFYNLYFNLEQAGGNLAYSIKQFKEFIIFNFGALSFFVTTLLVIVYQNVQKVRQQRKTLSEIMEFFRLTKLKQLDMPLLRFRMDLFVYCFIAIVCIVFLYLGKNNGAYMTYLFQLITPFFVIVLFHRFSKYLWIYVLSIPFLILNMQAISSNRMAQSIIPNDYMARWEKVYTAISNHINIYNSPAVTSILVAQNKHVYDSGLTEYMPTCKDRSSLIKFIFPPKKPIDMVSYYVDEINSNVINRQFDLIILPEQPTWTSNVLITTYYNKKDVINVPMTYTGQGWTLNIYEPKLNIL